MRLQTLLFILVMSLPAYPTTRQIDGINATGGPIIATPTTGSTFLSDTNSVTVTGKVFSGSNNTFTNIPATALATGALVGVANGGTGLASPGATGNVLTSNGTGWVSTAPSGGAYLPLTGGSLTGSLGISSSGTAYTSPALDINLTSGVYAFSALNSVFDVATFGLLSDSTLNNFLIVASGRATDQAARLFFSNSGSERFEIGQSNIATGSYSPDFVIGGNGNVGIGTNTAPGSKLTVQGALELDGSSSGHGGFVSPSTVSTPVIWTLPNGDGTSGQFLSTNGAGVLSWSSGGSGANTSLSNLGTTAMNTDLIWANTGSTHKLKTADGGSPGDPILITSGNANGGRGANVTIQAGDISSGASNYGQLTLVGNPAFIASNGQVEIQWGGNGGSNTDLLLDPGIGSAGQPGIALHVDNYSNDPVLMKFYSNTSYYAGIEAPNGSLSSSYSLTLPTSAGSANQVLTTDGSGVLSWQYCVPTTPTTTGSGVGSLTNVPGSHPGNPTGYIQVSIGGVPSYIPYWQ